MQHQPRLPCLPSVNDTVPCLVGSPALEAPVLTYKWQIHLAQVQQTSLCDHCFSEELVLHDGARPTCEANAATPPKRHWRTSPAVTSPRRTLSAMPSLPITSTWHGALEISECGHKTFDWIWQLWLSHIAMLTDETGICGVLYSLQAGRKCCKWVLNVHHR